MKIVRPHVCIGHIHRLGCIRFAQGRNPLHADGNHSLLVL